MTTTPPRFSANLFWDADPDDLDWERNMPYVIQRVLERGTESDLRTAFNFYTFPVVVDTAKRLRTLEPRALAFISAVSQIPREKFRCFTLKQSCQAPWVC